VAGVEANELGLVKHFAGVGEPDGHQSGSHRLRDGEMRLLAGVSCRDGDLGRHCRLLRADVVATAREGDRADDEQSADTPGLRVTLSLIV
jgi:hypothetical protein